MLDENQLVTVKWYSGNKRYYTELGYKFTKMNDTFQVPFYQLSQKSKAMVKVKCEYCGEEYTTRYYNYLTSIARGKPCCKKCKKFKVEETLKSKYGSESLGGSPILREKAKKAMFEKYGCEYALQSQVGTNNFKNSMLEKYGVDNPSKSLELQYKARNSMYINGTVPTSKPENEIVDMLIELYGEKNCYPGFPVDKVNLDCLLLVDDVKIDVEYDGKYWHQDKKDYDRKRNHWLMSLGYKVLRIEGNERDNLPTKQRLKEEVDYLIKGHSIGYIDMNN